MPRKRLMEYDNNSDKSSPRFNFRMDDEVKQILEQTKDRSQFVREAIVYYWEHVGDRGYSPPEFLPSEETVETDKPEKVSNGTWNPPWLSR